MKPAFAVGTSLLSSAPLRVLCGCLFVFQFVSGCATYAERTLKLHNAYYDNQLAAAQQEVTERLKHDRANSDLLQLDAAMIDLAEIDAVSQDMVERAIGEGDVSDLPLG